MKRHFARLLTAAGITSCTPATAITIFVTSDSGGKNVAESCTLRDAIAYSNSGLPSGGCGSASAIVNASTIQAPATSVSNVIELPVATTITLSAVDDPDRNVGLPPVTAPLVIHGNGGTIRRDPGVACGHDDALSPGEFGLIYNGTLLEIDDATLRDGCADAPAGTGPYGGAIYNAGQLTLARVILLDNYARIGGGALYSSGYGNNAGVVQVTASAFTGNGAQSGGAIYLAGSSAALVADGSVFEQNAAAEFFSGGALFVPTGTTAHVANSTFAQNSGGSGSAIQADGTVTLSFVTIAQNATASGSGGALQVSASGPVQQLTVKNSILADNDGGAGNCQLGLGMMTAAGADLSSDASCIGFSLNGADAQLAPLAGYGASATYALNPRSAAVNAVEDCTDTQGAPVGFDQRGMPRAQGAACDIGAFELGDRVFGDGFEIIVN